MRRCMCGSRKPPTAPGFRAVWPQLPEPFTIEKLVPMMDEAGVDRVVIVPPSWEGDRNDYALEAVKRYPGRFAVMGRIPLQNPQSAALLPKWKEQPGMLGIRVTFQRNLAAWLTDGTADWFWPAAEKAGLPVMFLASGQAPQFARIAERHPQLTLIIDHMGSPRTSQEACRRRSTRPSRSPNIRTSVQVSSAPTIRRSPIRFAT